MNTRTRLGGWMAALAGFLLLAGSAATSRADTFYWEGGAGTWTDTTKWSDFDGVSDGNWGPPGAGDDIVLRSPDTWNNNISLTANAAVRSIRVGTGAQQDFDILGSGGTRTLTIGAGGIYSVSPLYEFTLQSSLDVRLDGSQTWLWRHTGVGGYDMFVNGPVSRQSSDTANRALVVGAINGGQDLIVGGAISNGGASGSLEVWSIGPGTTYLYGPNTHTGGTTLNRGTLYLDADGLSTAGPLTLRLGTLGLSGATTTWTHGDVRVGSGNIKLSLAADSTFNMGTISRSGGGALQLTRNDTTHAVVGTYNVSNTNTHGILGAWAFLTSSAINGRGGEYIEVDGSGNLVVDTPDVTTALINDLTDGTKNYALSAGGTLTANRTANTVWINSSGAQTLALAANDLTVNGISGGKGSNGGNYQLTISSTGGRLVIGDSNELVLGGDRHYTVSAPIIDGAGGPGRLIITGEGYFGHSINSSNTHSGGTVYAPVYYTTKTLTLGHAWALGTGTFTISGGNYPAIAGNLTLATDNPQIWNANFSASSAGTLNMGAGNVSLGDGADASQTRSIDVSSGTFTIGGVITDGTHAIYPTINLTKTGAGTLELTGASTYSGVTTVSAGTLKLGASATLASTNLTVASGATLYLSGSASLADTATLNLNGVANPAGDIKERVGALYLGGVAQAAKKTYGSTASSATITSDTYFTPGSTGVIEVGVVPPAGTVIMLQ